MLSKLQLILMTVFKGLLVTCLAGNGHYYEVPVYWDEYIPLKQESYMEVPILKNA